MVSREKKLPDLFIYGHFTERGFHPGIRGGFLRGGAAVLTAYAIGHKEKNRDRNQEQKADAASFHRFESPSAARSLHLYIAHAHRALKATAASAFQNLLVWFE